MKRDPRGEYDIEDLALGRHTNHKKLLWGGTGIWDFKREELLNFRHAYVWDSEVVRPKLVSGQTLGQFFPMYFSTTAESECVKIAKKHFGQWKYDTTSEVIKVL